MRINHEIYLKEREGRAAGRRVCQLEGHICNLYGVQTNFAMLSQRGATAAPQAIGSTTSSGCTTSCAQIALQIFLFAARTTRPESQSEP